MNSSMERERFPARGERDSLYSQYHSTKNFLQGSSRRNVYLPWHHPWYSPYPYESQELRGLDAVQRAWKDGQSSSLKQTLTFLTAWAFSGDTAEVQMIPCLNPIANTVQAECKCLSPHNRKPGSFQARKGDAYCVVQLWKVNLLDFCLGQWGFSLEVFQCTGCYFGSQYLNSSQFFKVKEIKSLNTERG